MAWLSVGNSNDELCDKLIEHGIIKPGTIQTAFRLTDRGDFVQQEFRGEAYIDRPYKRDFVHISAPHMYVSVLEALDIKSGHAFLNIGSGSGYLSCLVATMIGEGGVSHGIEISSQAVEHSQRCCENWFRKIKERGEQGESVPRVSLEGVLFVEGNCFDLDLGPSISACRYDRIYVGAGCPSSRAAFFRDLLADEGVMVLPDSDAGMLTQVRKVCGSVYSSQPLGPVHFAPLLRPQGDGRKITLPPLKWLPTSSRHRQFPSPFRQATRTLIMGRKPSSPGPLLPSHLWGVVLSFASRDWFVPLKDWEARLRAEVEAERRLRTEAEDRARKATDKLREVERERDLYKAMVGRLRVVRGTAEEATAGTGGGGTGGQGLVQIQTHGHGLGLLGLALLGMGFGIDTEEEEEVNEHQHALPNQEENQGVVNEEVVVSQNDANTTRDQDSEEEGDANHDLNPMIAETDSDQSEISDSGEEESQGRHEFNEEDEGSGKRLRKST